MRKFGAWKLLLGPTAFTAILILVVGVAVIGVASSNTANNAAAEQSGSNVTFCTASTSGGDAAAASTTALPTVADPSMVAAGTAALAPATLTAAEQVGNYNLTAQQVHNAQVIVAVAKAMKLDQRAVQVALVVAEQDSGLNASASIDSGDIAGMFHQKAGDYPGVNLTDPVAATTAFYVRLRRLAEYISPKIDVGEVAQAMQKPRGAGTTVYAARDAWAKSLVDLLDTGNPSATSTPGAVAYDCLSGQQAVAVPGLTPAQAKNAQIIVGVGLARKLSVRAATIAVAVAIAESTLLNYANDGTSADEGYFDDGHRQLNAQERAVARESLNFPHDAIGHNLDSEGLFQQRPSARWGSSAELMNPATSAGKFYDHLVGVTGYDTGDPAVVAQTVQGSNDSSGGIYATTYPQAVTIVAALAKATSTSAGGGGVVVVDGPKITLPAKAGIAGTIVAPNAQVAKVIVAGLNWLGEAYSYAGGSPTGPTTGQCSSDPGDLGWNDCHIVGFDCSGLMLYMWAQVGITLPRYSQDQWAMGQQIPYDQKLPGDMIAYRTHIAMYVGTWGGVDYMLEAPQSGMNVRVTPVRNHADEPHYATVSRVWK